ncbi:MAG: hypothetical protein LUI12_01855 [Clostridiales bacterium]|nr:hypothetical protein [Clostridiales bacterium]
MAEQVTLAVIISIISVAFSVYFGLKNSRRTDSKDFEENVKNNTRINMKLDEISRNVTDMRVEITSMREDMKSHNDRIIKVEESCKQAHHRIDGIEDRLNLVKDE